MNRWPLSKFTLRFFTVCEHEKSRGLYEDMKDKEVRNKREERVLACVKRAHDSHSRLTVDVKTCSSMDYNQH